MIRVANYIEEARVGGPQLRMVRVARALRGEVDTLIVMPRANSTSFQQVCATHEVPYRAVPLTRMARRMGAALKYVIFWPVEVIRLASLFRHEGVTLVHVSGGSWQNKGVIAARLVGLPVIWHLNDTAAPVVIRKAFRLIQGLATGFIFASQRSRQYYGEADSDRPQATISSVVDVNRFRLGVKVETDHLFASGQNTPQVIGIIANVNRLKGFDTAIRALAALISSGYDVCLVVVGAVFENQKPYHRRLLDLADSLGVAKRIHWVGSSSDVRPWLQLMDVYVCSSWAESSPMSVWEAMAMERPIVSTDVGDVPLHVINGESGFIVSVGDCEAMATCIGTLLDDKALRRQFGTRARENAVENFSVEKVAKATADVYEKVLEYWRLRHDSGAERKHRW